MVQEGDVLTDWLPSAGDLIPLITNSDTQPTYAKAGDIWVTTTAPVTSNIYTAGAWVPSGNIATALSQVDSTASTKLSGIAEGATANQSDDTTNNAIAAKLSKAGDTITGTIGFDTSVPLGIYSGSAPDGVLSTGVAFNTNGIVGKKAGVTTFAINSATGDAIFGGTLDAAKGTFSGTLTANAINAVSTINIAGNAVTVPSFTQSSAVIVHGDGDWHCRVKKWTPLNTENAFVMAIATAAQGFLSAVNYHWRLHLVDGNVVDQSGNITGTNTPYNFDTSIDGIVYVVDGQLYGDSVSLSGGMVANGGGCWAFLTWMADNGNHITGLACLTVMGAKR